MTILDAFAVVAYLRGEPAAAEVTSLLSSGDAILTSVGMAEVIDRMVRLAGAEPDEIALDLASLGLLDTDPLTVDTSIAAGVLRSKHYHRTRRAVSLADCIAAEVARTTGRTLATADPHLLDLCVDEQIAHAALPDSSGKRWPRNGA